MMWRALAVVVLFVVLGCGGVQRPDGGRGILSVGAQVPQLKAHDQHGRLVELQAGGVSVVYFYPRDGTPGCTREACAFRDAWRAYQALSVRVIGVSGDSAETHRRFADEHGLAFSLVSDSEHVWSRAFGVGTVMGMSKRVTFLIDARGRIVRVYEDIDPGVHADEVLRDAAGARSGS